MKKTHSIVQYTYITCGILVTLSSCYYGGAYDPYIVDFSRQQENYYYAPAAQNLPLPGEKNDLSLALHGSVGDRQMGANMHAAFNPGKHVGLMTSYTSIKNDDALDHGIAKIKSFGLGAGYFKKFADRFHFETYGGVGFSGINNRHYTGGSKITSTNFFLQPAVSISNQAETVQFAFVSKFSLNHFKIKDTSFNNDREPLVTGQMKIINDKPSQVFWEPGFVIRAGWKEIMFQAGYSVSTDLTNKELYRSKNEFSVGMILKINTAKKVK